MRTVIPFFSRTDTAGADDWRLIVLQDALHGVLHTDLVDARRIASAALAETCGEVTP